MKGDSSGAVKRLTGYQKAKPFDTLTDMQKSAPLQRKTLRQRTFIYPERHTWELKNLGE